MSRSGANEVSRLFLAHWIPVRLLFPSFPHSWLLFYPLSALRLNFAGPARLQPPTKPAVTHFLIPDPPAGKKQILIGLLLIQAPEIVDRELGQVGHCLLCKAPLAA